MKNLTKKLSLLIALCMIVTVGGVYAQWTYSSSDDTTNEAQGTIIVDMQSAVNSSQSQGHFEVLLNTIRIEVQDNINGTVDVGTEQGDYIPELHITGQLVILYTMYEDDSQLPEKIGMTHTLSTTSDMKYNDKDIFVITNSPETIYSVAQVNGTDSSNAYYYETLNTEWNLGSAETNDGRALTNSDTNRYIFIVNADTLKLHLSLDPSIKLQTLNEYHAFESVIASANLLFKINDGSISTAALDDTPTETTTEAPTETTEPQAETTTEPPAA